MRRNTRGAKAGLRPRSSGKVVPQFFYKLSISPEKTIHLYAVVSLYREEMDLKFRDGSNSLLDRFGDADVTDIVDVQLRNVARKRFGLF